MRASIMLLALFLTACAGPSFAAPAGQEYVTRIVFNDAERAWVNREPDPTANVVGVYYQAAGELPRVVEIERGVFFGLVLANEGLYYTNDVSLLLYRRSGERVALYETNGLVTAPVLDDDFVYMASTSFTPDPDGTLHHVIEAFPRAGGARIALYDRAERVVQLIVDETSFYWVELAQPDGALTVWRAPKDGTGTPGILVDLGADLIIVPSLYRDGDRLYYNRHDRLWEFSRGAIEFVPIDGSSAPSALYEGNFVGAGQVFSFVPGVPRLIGIAPGSPNDLVEFPIAGGAATPVASCREYCGSVTAARGRVMWSDARGVQPPEL